jgi:hypothetical protein
LLADALCAGLPTPHILRPEVSSEPRETFGQVKRRGQETRAERVGGRGIASAHAFAA